MTVIKFHGLLAKKFGFKIKLHLGNLNFLTSAIDSAKPGFLNFIKEKEKNSQFYCASTKSNEKIIDIFPCLMGAGKMGLMIATIVFFGIVGFVIVGAIAGWFKDPMFWKILGYGLQVLSLVLGFMGPVGFILSFVAAAAAAAASGYGNYLEAMQAIEKMMANRPKLSSGGDASIIAANGKSYIFNRTINFATQGTPIPLIYGKLKLGSKLVALNVKTTNSSLVFDGEPWKSIEAAEIYG